jgi:hypothetical protein
LLKACEKTANSGSKINSAKKVSAMPISSHFLIEATIDKDLTLLMLKSCTDDSLTIIFISPSRHVF